MAFDQYNRAKILFAMKEVTRIPFDLIRICIKVWIRIRNKYDFPSDAPAMETITEIPAHSDPGELARNPASTVIIGTLGQHSLYQSFVALLGYLYHPLYTYKKQILTSEKEIDCQEKLQRNVQLHIMLGDSFSLYLAHFLSFVSLYLYLSSHFSSLSFALFPVRFPLYISLSLFSLFIYLSCIALG